MSPSCWLTDGRNGPYESFALDYGHPDKTARTIRCACPAAPGRGPGHRSAWSGPLSADLIESMAEYGCLELGWNWSPFGKVGR